jgi:hypothetical protein
MSVKRGLESGGTYTGANIIESWRLAMGIKRGISSHRILKKIQKL